MTILLENCPITLQNRKFYPGFSVFDTRAFSPRVHALLLHNNKEAERTTVYLDEQTKTLSVDMRPEEYKAFWALLWSQSVPALTVQLDATDHTRVQRFSIGDLSGDCE